MLNRSATARSSREESAFTLPEIMVSMTVFTLVVGGIISAHLVGIKMYEWTKTKLAANDQARVALRYLVDDIRTSKRVAIGSGSASSFTEAAPGSSQQGNSIQVYPSTNLNSYIRYYLDGSDDTLKRVRHDGSDFRHIALHVTNTVVFTSEDYQGNILTDNQNNRVIGLRLEFYRLQYPIISIGQGGVYDYYQLRTKITRRALE